jgi:aryl-alcohol dehydrogenase-like predicted oxidoreductase
LQQICRDAKLSVFPYFSLASGFLTGKYRTKADAAGVTRQGLVERYLDDRGMRILAAMDAIAADRAITHAQIAIAWLLAQPEVTSPIVSATSIAQLEKTLDAVDVRLTADELAALGRASAN